MLLRDSFFLYLLEALRVVEVPSNGGDPGTDPAGFVLLWRCYRLISLLLLRD